MLGVVKFPSRTNVSFPMLLKELPRLIAMVVFPTPPFPETIAMNLVILSFLKCIPQILTCQQDTPQASQYPHQGHFQGISE